MKVAMKEAELAQPDLTLEQKVWALAAVIPFLLSIALLGYALKSGTLLMLAIVWPALQIFGYVGALGRAKGDTAHYLFKAQVFLHFTALLLIIATMVVPR